MPRPHFAPEPHPQDANFKQMASTITSMSPTPQNIRVGEDINEAKLPLGARLWDVILCTFDLGFTAFGGPPVHFQILHRRFVDGLGQSPWIDEQTYQELFAICQALPGPASTKLIFSITQIHAGTIPALLAFTMWCLPGAIVMYSLSLVVQNLNEELPAIIYALLSGLNAATVGVIALSAVQLSRRAITDQLTRILVVFGGCAGLCHNAIWYFPVLILFGGSITLIWDITRLQRSTGSRPGRDLNAVVSLVNDNLQEDDGLDEDTVTTPLLKSHQKNISTSSSMTYNNNRVLNNIERRYDDRSHEFIVYSRAHAVPVKLGVLIISIFFISFASLMLIRTLLPRPPLLLSLFNDMFLAGTVIFGGGPVVIPLLREYVVVPGWVSSRDFLLGLAIIQSLPGPNFNFAVYLGALTVAQSTQLRSLPTLIGAILAFLGIFSPGLWLAVGFQSIWSVLRGRREVNSMLKGINATAVGLVFTAVYRLWEIGYLSPENSQGASLGWQPWWLVIASTTYTVVEWYYTPPAVAIVMGGFGGLLWHGVRQINSTLL